MSTKYPNINKDNVRNPTMRKWFKSILEQTGGMTRYVDLLNQKDSTGKHTKEATELYVQMLDKCIKLEPKEQIGHNTITVQLDIPSLPQHTQPHTIKEVTSIIDGEQELGASSIEE